MKLKLLIPLIFAGSSVFAQDLSVGIRTGIGRNFYGRDKETWCEVNHVWNKQAFFRHDMRQRFAIELGIEHFSYVDAGPIPQYIADPGYNVNRSSENSHHFIYNFSFQYRLTPGPLANNAPILGKFKSYIGIFINPCFVIRRNIYDITYKDGRTTQLNHSYSYEYLFMGGLNHTLTYHLNRHWVASYVFSYQLDFRTAVHPEFNQFLPFQNHLSYQIGMGYAF